MLHSASISNLHLFLNNILRLRGLSWKRLVDAKLSTETVGGWHKSSVAMAGIETRS